MWSMTKRIRKYVTICLIREKNVWIFEPLLCDMWLEKWAIMSMLCDLWHKIKLMCYYYVICGIRLCKCAFIVWFVAWYATVMWSNLSARIKKQTKSFGSNSIWILIKQIWTELNWIKSTFETEPIWIISKPKWVFMYLQLNTIIRVKVIVLEQELPCFHERLERDFP